MGNTDMYASALNFCGSEIRYQHASPRTVARLLGSALDAGLNVIDTAECYEDSEELIGKALGKRRGQVYLFSKCGHARAEARSDWRPEALARSIERSLARTISSGAPTIRTRTASGPSRAATSRRTSARCPTASARRSRATMS